MGYLSHIDKIIDTALDEDVGSGDITTSAIIVPSLKGKAQLLAREELLLAGIDVFSSVFSRLDPEIVVECTYHDGDVIPKGSNIGTVTGSMRGILSGERTALNFLQRLSGIATLTRQYVEKTDPSTIRVIDTRKTTPGLRILEKYAVRVGGGFNHRFGLFDGILIKDNHIAAAGCISEAVKKVKATVPHTLKIEIEVEDIKGLEEAIEAGADAILLDNMPVKEMKEAVSIARGRVLLEASGGITLEKIEEISKTGVNLISVGAITHSARSVDISLEVMKK
ncbi:MAG: carboxylating nicotinate-nucleotide diphosphorylase [Deltaproteobacteria bacterium]|nr:MAG: carboxylating nicotinate-nucleotide diphosphorylase [Deltaproteobacteria bacterium]